MIRASRAVALGLIAVVAVACHKKKPEVAPTPAASPPARTTPVANAPNTSARDDSIARAEAARRAGEDARRRAIEAARATLSAPVYFDYDQSDIRDDQRAQLEAKVPILTSNPGLRIRVEGHTDDRGSDEYNLALGQRRAATVRRFLADRGIDAARVEIVSFGEERPSQQGDSEEAWARNRRAEFVITAGGDNLTVGR